MQELEKVISLRRVPHVTEGKVPSWNDFMGARKEFEAAIGQLWEKIKDIEDNKQALWNAVNEFKRDPKADIYAEFRALRDAAFSAKEQLNGPLPDDGWHVWKCIEVAAEERKDLAKQIDSIRSDASRAFRAVIDETLYPVFQYGLDQALRRLMELESENKRLQSTIDAMAVRLTEIEKRLDHTSATH